MLPIGVAIVLAAAACSGSSLTPMQEELCALSLHGQVSTIEMLAHEASLQTYTQWMTSEAGIESEAVVLRDLPVARESGELSSEDADVLAAYGDEQGGADRMIRTYLSTNDGTEACLLFVDYDRLSDGATTTVYP